MKKLFVVLFLFVLFAVFSQDANKARDFVKKGIEFWKKFGKEKALEEFSNLKGKFVDGEYYLFVHDYTGITEGKVINIARGDGNKAMIGKNFWLMKDTDGIFYVQEFVKAAQSKECFGWVDYKRTNPTTKKIEQKSSYIEKVPNEFILIGCGFYK